MPRVNKRLSSGESCSFHDGEKANAFTRSMYTDAVANGEGCKGVLAIGDKFLFFNDL